MLPNDLETTSLTPASSKTILEAPPAIIPRPALAGLINTLAAPQTPVTSWEIVLPSTKYTCTIFFSASLIALLTATGISLDLPVPIPTLPFLSPTATVAENLKLRPPWVTLVTLPIEIILSSYNFFG